jgi:hypothetical protein
MISYEEKEVYQRIVCFKFKPAASLKAIQAHMAHFARLADQIPQITSYSGGLTIADEHGNPPGFDSLHIATYHSMADIEAYFHHAAHQKFIETHKEIWADVLVLNSQIA